MYFSFPSCLGVEIVKSGLQIESAICSNAKYGLYNCRFQFQYCKSQISNFQTIYIIISFLQEYFRTFPLDLTTPFHYFELFIDRFAVAAIVSHNLGNKVEGWNLSKCTGLKHVGVPIWQQGRSNDIKAFMLVITSRKWKWQTDALVR